tara:strand:+ start:975 stop:1190 length:216 start_codon:yes stop_codon:yes gene_type:complete
LCCAANHHSIGTGIGENSLCFLWRIDIAIGDHGQGHRVFDRADRVIFHWASILALTGAAVNGDCLDTGGFR